MTDRPSGSHTRNSKVIRASRETLYRAFTDPSALVVWQVPGEMEARVHDFDLRVGGGYQMSLYYPEVEKEPRGKTSAKEDRYTSRFIQLIPARKIVQAITFESDDPAFSGDMIMEVTFETVEGGTEVTVIFKNIPSGIRPEDNEAGTSSSLEKLAAFVKGE